MTIKNSGNVPEAHHRAAHGLAHGTDGAIKIEPVGAEGAASSLNYLRLAPDNAVVAPGETKEFSLTLDLPATFPSIAGVNWGGFLMRAVPVSGQAMFGPAATIVVYNTIGSPRTHVKLTQLHVTQDGPDRANVVARVLNDGTGYARPSARILVTRDGKVVRDETENMAVIFGGAPRIYSKALTGLSSGEYEFTMTVDYGGATLLEGTTTFRIK